jgi:hypothetical protein
MSSWDPNSDYTPINTEQIGLPRRVDSLFAKVNSILDALTEIQARLDAIERQVGIQ